MWKEISINEDNKIKKFVDLHKELCNYCEGSFLTEDFLKHLMENALRLSPIFI